MVGCLAKLGFRGKDLGTASLDVPDFGDTSWEVLPFLRSG